MNLGPHHPSKRLQTFILCPYSCPSETVLYEEISLPHPASHDTTYERERIAFLRGSHDQDFVALLSIFPRETDYFALHHKADTRPIPDAPRDYGTLHFRAWVHI